MLFPRRIVIASVLLLAAAPLGYSAAPAITPLPAGASERIAAVQVRVVPERAGWTYATGERARFHVSVVADGQPLAGVPITFTVGQEARPATEQTATVPQEGFTIDGGTLDEPGFVRCVVQADVAGRKWRGVATAGFSPERIMPTQTEPADFDEFWRRGLDELARIPIEARLTLLPEACTDVVNVYHVSFRTVWPEWMQTAGRIYGILCEPKRPGQFPALLRVPGAGVRPYGGDVGNAARGAITLEIGVHGLPVNQPKEIYDQLAAGALDGYYFFNLDDRERYYFRRIYLSCVRAVDFLTSRENWDGRTVVVAGASQGGLLSMVTGALDPRVTAVVVTHPAGCDLTGDLHGRAGGWPWPFKQWEHPAPSPHATPAKIATTAYYDAVNFARRLKMPGYYNWGYNDDICAPTSMFAAYNVITAPKTLGLTLELAHSYTPEQGAAIEEHIRRFLGVK